MELQSMRVSPSALTLASRTPGTPRAWAKPELPCTHGWPSAGRDRTASLPPQSLAARSTAPPSPPSCTLTVADQSWGEAIDKQRTRGGWVGMRLG